MERFEAGQALDWSVFSNYRKATDRLLGVHTVDRAALAATRTRIERLDESLARHIGDFVDDE